jgi:hypothetical protein
METSQRRPDLSRTSLVPDAEADRLLPAALQSGEFLR